MQIEKKKKQKENLIVYKMFLSFFKMFDTFMLFTNY